MAPTRLAAARPRRRSRPPDRRRRHAARPSRRRRRGRGRGSGGERLEAGPAGVAELGHDGSRRRSHPRWRGVRCRSGCPAARPGRRRRPTAAPGVRPEQRPAERLLPGQRPRPCRRPARDDGRVGPEERRRTPPRSRRPRSWWTARGDRRQRHDHGPSRARVAEDREPVALRVALLAHRSPAARSRAPRTVSRAMIARGLGGAALAHPGRDERVRSLALRGGHGGQGQACRGPGV